MIALRLYEPTSSPESTPPASQPKLTVRTYYEREMLPAIRHEVRPRSLDEDRVALRHWERYSQNPEIGAITREHIALFRDGLAKQRGCGPATVNKYWREIKAILQWAADEDEIPKVPVISKRSKSRLMIESPKNQRESLTTEEVTALYQACSKATYPAQGPIPAPKLWRVAIVLWWHYGARTLDVVRELNRDNILWSDRLLKFRAMKTRKLQGVPLTDLVIKHLKSIESSTHKLFPGFNTAGHRSQKTGKWKRGYYTTWRNEIQPAAGLSEINIKHFRETMVTRNNGVEPGLGSWIAGHYMPGVSAQNYDLPTKRIREAIESIQVPACFHEID